MPNPSWQSAGKHALQASICKAPHALLTVVCLRMQAELRHVRCKGR